MVKSLTNEKTTELENQNSMPPWPKMLKSLECILKLSSGANTSSAPWLMENANESSEVANRT